MQASGQHRLHRPASLSRELSGHVPHGDQGGSLLEQSPQLAFGNVPLKSSEPQPAGDPPRRQQRCRIFSSLRRQRGEYRAPESSPRARGRRSTATFCRGVVPAHRATANAQGAGLAREVLSGVISDRADDAGALPAPRQHCAGGGGRPTVNGRGLGPPDRQRGGCG